MAERRPVVDVPSGYTVGGWRIGEPIASGSWGSVYSATRPGGRGPATAACKFLPGNALTPAQRSTVHDLARREREFSERVRGAHLISTYEVVDVVDPQNPALDGCTVIVMERARTSLREILDHAGDGPVDDAVAMLTALAGALDDVHSAGWVHGDVTPSNILVMDDGTVRLSDFGLSAELDGTHAYMPQLGSFDHTPAEWWSEQVGDRGVEVRPSRDIWAFGVIAHQLLTGGRHPFAGADARSRALAVREYASTGQGLLVDARISDTWRRLLEAALDGDQTERGRLAGTLAARVRLTAQQPVMSTSERAPVPAAPRIPRRHKAVALVCLAALVGGGVAAASAGRDGDEGGSGSDTPGDQAPRAERLAPGQIAPDAAVPDRYRGIITRSALRCPDPAVSPAFVAAMLATESGFDPRKRSPRTGEYGIAMWTPWIFREWAPKRRHGHPSVFNPRDSIRAMTDYLCYLNGQLEGVPLDDPRYLAVAYRTSEDVVNKRRRIPAEYRDYADEVARHLDAFAVPA